MSQLQRGLGLAGVAGGIGIMAYAIVYAYTHGTTTVNNMDSLLGLNEQEWGRIAVAIPALLWAGLLAFRLHIGGRITRISAIGYGMASLALVLRLISEVPQWFIDMRTEYQSPLGMTSWYVYLVSIPLLTTGMIMMGVGCRRSRVSRWAFYTPLLVGLFVITTFAASGYLAELSDGSTLYHASMIVLSVPQGLAWIGLSILSLCETLGGRYE